MSRFEREGGYIYKSRHATKNTCAFLSHCPHKMPDTYVLQKKTNLSKSQIWIRQVHQWVTPTFIGEIGIYNSMPKVNSVYPFLIYTFAILSEAKASPTPARLKLVEETLPLFLEVFGVENPDPRGLHLNLFRYIKTTEKGGKWEIIYNRCMASIVQRPKHAWRAPPPLKPKIQEFILSIWPGLIKRSHSLYSW